MKNLKAVEARRQEEQQRFESLQGAAERNRLGQFATPPPLALDILKYARALWEKRTEPVRFLDPAIGTGAFYSALCNVFPKEVVAQARGLELDPLLADVAASLWEETGLSVTRGDFTKQPFPSGIQRFNLVIANPPYVRHHHLEREEKERLQALVSQTLGMKVSGLAGLYCYFLLLCDKWLDDDGLAIWLVPSEFMDVNYGTVIKKYLTSKIELLRLHRFSPSDSQFSDALVSSAIIIFKKSPPPPSHTVEFSFGGSLLEPCRTEHVSLEQLSKAHKWTAYPQNGDPRTEAEKSDIAFGDLFFVKRGVATGANKFFILPKEDALRCGIPLVCLKPILPSPRYLTNPIIEGDDDGYPIIEKIEKPLALIDCDLPEESLQRTDPDFWTYLQKGKELSIHEGYLASRRFPWYSQEKRPPAPFLCTYMGRSKGESKPFRFFWNKSAATAANVYLLLYPKGALKALLHSRPELSARLLEAFQQIEVNKLINEGRVYGGGLYKIEPKELARLSAQPLVEVLGDLDIARERQLELF